MSASNVLHIESKKEISPVIRDYILICWQIWKRLEMEKEEEQKTINKN